MWICAARSHTSQNISSGDIFTADKIASDKFAVLSVLKSANKHKEKKHMKIPKKNAQKQKEINARIFENYKEFCDTATPGRYLHIKRLRSSSAWVEEYDNYYALRSYSTEIAIIDKRNGVCYDFLRWAYGYTATSAQHIAKFCRDYNAATKLTYYEV